MPPQQKWYHDPHVWALILADTISIIGLVTKYLPPEYATILASIAHALYSVDQIVTGALQNQTPTATDTVTTTSKVSVPIDPPHIEL